MVDITKGVGNVQGAQNQSANKTLTSGKSSEKPSGTSSVGEVEVSISSEALSVSQAETTAQNVRDQLEASEQSLSKAGSFDRFLE